MLQSLSQMGQRLIRLVLFSWVCGTITGSAKEPPTQVIVWREQGASVLPFTLGKFKEVGSVGSERTFMTETTPRTCGARPSPTPHLRCICMTEISCASARPQLALEMLALRLMLLDGSFKLDSRKQLQQLAKNTAYSIHGEGIASVIWFSPEPISP